MTAQGIEPEGRAKSHLPGLTVAGRAAQPLRLKGLKPLQKKGKSAPYVPVFFLTLVSGGSYHPAHK